MADGSNLSDMTKTAINALMKPEIVKKILELKDKLAVGKEIKSLCTHIKKLMDTVNQILSKNERLNSDLAVQKSICGHLEKKIKVWKFKYQRMSSTSIVAFRLLSKKFCLQLFFTKDSVSLLLA